MFAQRPGSHGLSLRAMPRMAPRPHEDGAETRCRRSRRRWGFVFAIARTWKTVEGKALKDLVTHMSRTYYQRTRVACLPGAHGSRKPFGDIARPVSAAHRRRHCGA